MSGAREVSQLLTTPPNLPLSPNTSKAKMKKTFVVGFCRTSLVFLLHLPSGEALYTLHGAAMTVPSLALGSPWAAGSWETEVGEN